MDGFISDNIENYHKRKRFERKIQENFKRVVNDTCETVKYFKETSILIWYNVECLEFPTHWHQALEIIMPLEYDYHIESASGNFDLKPYEILVIPPGELHSIRKSERGSRLIFLFEFEKIAELGGFSNLHPFLSHPALITKENCPDIYDKERKLLEEIFAEYANSENLWELQIYSKLIEFLVEYGRFKIPKEVDISDSKQDKTKDMMDKINKAFDYLDTHYMEEVSLEKAAEVAGFSKFHFSRLFKECTGQNFYDFLCYKRIRATENLLLNPEISITDIAAKCGFSSPSTFNRTFKRFKGCSPSEYRNLFRKTDKV